MEGDKDINLNEEVSKHPILFLTCIELRVDLFQIFQLDPGDAFIFRNAGNIITNDVKRAIYLTVFKYDVENIIVLGHLDCGMARLRTKELLDILPPEVIGSLSDNPKYPFLDLIEFFKPFTDEIRNIKTQVQKIKMMRGLPSIINVMGMLYDAKNGWIYDLEESGELETVDHFKFRYKDLVKYKKDELIGFLQTIQNNQVIEKFTSRNTSNDPVEEKTSFEIEGISKEIFNKEFSLKNLNFSIETPNISIPKLYLPKIKVNIPSIGKYGMNKKEKQ